MLEGSELHIMMPRHIALIRVWLHWWCACSLHACLEHALACTHRSAHCRTSRQPVRLTSMSRKASLQEGMHQAKHQSKCWIAHCVFDQQSLTLGCSGCTAATEHKVAAHTCMSSMLRLDDAPLEGTAGPNRLCHTHKSVRPGTVHLT
jgi:hypothetical protein